MEERSYFRSFGGIDDNEEIPLAKISTEAEDSINLKSQVLQSKLESLRENIIGANEPFLSPFGANPIIYTDWTASGRNLKMIETYIQENIMPFYGNTHTSTSITGHQSTCFRHEARQIIAEAVNAKITGKAAMDVVIFTGTGTTGAIMKLVLSLGLNIPLSSELDEEIYRPIVFTSSYEHHSNLLPWRESICEVVTIAYDPVTGVDLVDLQKQLDLYAHRKLKIGTFSAASNVSGIITDVDSVAIIMHKGGGLAFFDYATAAPYVRIDMNPVGSNGISSSDIKFAYKDAIFFSGHKFLGGPGAPGCLVAKKSLLPNAEVPTIPGGGTVFYVTDEHHRYLSNKEEREESGTPDVLGDIKLGLVMNLKTSIGASWIEKEEIKISSFVQEKLQVCENIVLLGRDSKAINNNMLPIFSFLVKFHGKFLHYNFVSALLNDLFGIQSRGGCQCAGPFSQYLLGLAKATNDLIELALLEKNEVFRPGYTRVSFPYWMSMKDIDFVIDAISFIANHGFQFLPLYRYNHKTGEWAHTTRLTRFPERRWLSSFNYFESERKVSQLEQEIMSSNDLMLRASTELQKLEKSNQKYSSAFKIEDDLESIRWFVLPSDIRTLENSQLISCPIQPRDTWFHNTDPITHYLADDKKVSAYGIHRDNKLKARQGGSIRSDDIPRYLRIIKDPHDVASIQNTNKVDSNVSIVTLNNLVDDARKDTVSIDPNSAVCTSGSCFLPRKSSLFQEAPMQSTTIIPTDSTIENGRIRSGKGLQFSSSDVNPKRSLCAVPKKIMKLVGQAIKDWSMIENGDRILLGLSGGKDSLCLLHVLLALQKRAPVKFEIACATVDPQTESYDPSPLIPYLQSLGVTYHYLSEPIVELAKSKLQGDSLCAFCSRFKRGLLYSCCR